MLKKTTAPILDAIKQLIGEAKKAKVTAIKISSGQSTVNITASLPLPARSGPVTMPFTNHQITRPLLQAVVSRLKIMANLPIHTRGVVLHGKARSGNIWFRVVTTGDLIGGEHKIDEMLILFT